MTSFDGLCQCLKTRIDSDRTHLSVLPIGGRLTDVEGRNPAKTSAQYEKLCEWLLRICRDLLSERAESQQSAAPISRNSVYAEEELFQERRFKFFLFKVSKIQIWRDQDNALFERLKMITSVNFADLSLYSMVFYSILPYAILQNTVQYSTIP